MEVIVGLAIFLVGVMVGISACRVWAIPAGARIPLRFAGPTGFQTSVPKPVALVLWPALGALLAWGAASASDQASGGSGNLIGILVLFSLTLVAAAQLEAVRRAARL